MTTPREDGDARASLETLRAAVSRETAAKMSERRGRIKAERELREAKLRLLALTHEAGVDARARDRHESGIHSDDVGDRDSVPGDAGTSSRDLADRIDSNDVDVFPLTPIGRFRSSFSCRNGTPRQPQLVPLARGRFTLARHVPPAALEGLQDFSHVWIIYVFHKNTDLQRAFEAGSSDTNTNAKARGNAERTRYTSRAKVRVPRLNGERRGVLATRSPHRPLPIGLSLCEIVSVDLERGFLDVKGADLVNGTPVLDVKPYLPFCEAVPSRLAFAPEWVNFESTESAEPLLIASVNWAEGSKEALHAVWVERNERNERRLDRSLYVSGDEFCAFVVQALSRDIRSAHQRQKQNEVVEETELSTTEDTENMSNTVNGEWEVVLDGISVRYDVIEGGILIVGGSIERRTCAGARD